MSPTQYTSPLQQPSAWHPPPDNYEHIQLPPLHDSGRVVFTRQLWQRTMPDENQSEQGVSDKSHTAISQDRNNSTSRSSRRTSSSVSLRSHNRSLSPARESKTPLTPEESPPFQNTRKRSAGTAEEEDRPLSSSNTSPAHTRANSGESTAHVCICQPEPKIPRPRNAFILYRQHHQAAAVAQHPGLANPEISKIIGEQWQNQPVEEKNRWKALAEEEKIRHQQQYPTYRYQPKRNGRRNSHSDQAGSSGEKAKCQKCGGRSILTPSTPFSGSVPHTPGSSATPVSRTVPVFRALTLQSPAARSNSRSYQSNMSPSQNEHMIERDGLGPLSPGNKRRKFNGDHGISVSRAMPPRYGVNHPGMAVGPGTPFPFAQMPPPHHFPPAVVHARRESLPGLRCVGSPTGPMAPPPRPGMGYQQHRLSQGHVPLDRSLTLPPLQTGHPEPSTSAVTAGRTTGEQIMNIDFRYKVKVLSQIAPPVTKSKEQTRGPLIAVEGDSAAAAEEFAHWLRDMLNGSDDLAARVVDGPKISASGGKEDVMAQYHRLISEWLVKSKAIVDSIMVPAAADKMQADSAMPDAISPPPPQSGRKLDEDCNDAETESRQSSNVEEADKSDEKSDKSSVNATESMDVDKDSKRTSTTSTNSKQQPTTAKPISIIANYSLSTSNLVACLIPLESNDPYSPNDHWQWTATQWRGIIGPDLTIYIRDAASTESGRPPVEIDVVEGKMGVGLFIMRRTKTENPADVADGKESLSEVDASVLRRMGFEVGEWVRAFGTSNAI